MEGFGSIVARFPQRELDIWRRCARDARFRAICSDYEEMTAALDHLLKSVGNGDPKIEEYTSFLGELEAEILGYLDNSISNEQKS
ncbi:hypothetical protein H2509_02610 [Stappia sp. F7233]|uniref:Uncharacterized protein n=1 Tax=Stappia albiluteola TaxID=2758565 RepID=A0A839A905_9HYPH|nr:hypothetical protein [Stappia albiluteola]MBA5776013.1 hypothetical protein [Stappia albiluteola]